MNTMSLTQTHTIYKCNAEIVFNNAKEDFFLQNKIADLLKEKILPAVETLFDTYTSPNKKIKIESLKIDVGNIGDKNWEDKFISQTVSCIRQKLNEVVSFTGTEEVYEVNYKNDVPIVNSKQLTDELIDNFSGFLQNGTLAWNTTQLTSFGLLNELIQQSLKNNLSPAQKEKLLHIIFYSDKTLERFLLQFSDDVLLNFFDKILQLKNIRRLFSLKKNKYAEQHQTKIIKWVSVLQQFKSEIKMGDEVLISLHKKNFNQTDTIEKAKTLHPSKKINNTDEYFISNAGIVILANFLQQLFINLGLSNKKEFISAEKQMRAILLTQYLVTGETQISEHDLLLNKIICGFPFSETLPAEFIPTENEKNQCEELLQSVLEYWKELKTTNTQTLCNTYILRNGKLTDENDYWLLQVEYKTHDVMLQFLPWSIGIIYLPWMEKRLMVEWNS